MLFCESPRCVLWAMLRFPFVFLKLSGYLTGFASLGKLVVFLRVSACQFVAGAVIVRLPCTSLDDAIFYGSPVW